MTFKQKIGNVGDFFPKCNRCGNQLPLLHPHIIVECADEDGEPVCEACYQKITNRPGSTRCSDNTENS